MPTYPSKFTKQERLTFGRTLQRMLVEQNMTPAELSRAATKQLPPGKKMGRDVITRYTTGRSIPTPVNLKVIARVLGADPNLMIPRDYAQRPGEGSSGSTLTPPRARDVRMTTVEDNMANLMVNVHLPRAVAWKLAQAIEAELDKMPSVETPRRK